MLGIENGGLTGKDVGFRSGPRQHEAAARWASRLALPATIILGLAPAAFAQDPNRGAPPPSVPSIERRVDAFVTQLEARRKELGVVGASVVIAHRDRIVRVAGLGDRSLEPAQPVTEDTVFAIASVTKMFTAMAVALAVGEGRMAFEDHPRRFVPTFRLKDPEADAKVNFIDLLVHRTGLGRSDFTFLHGSFTQAEMFELAARSKPAAKFREKHIYNNTMYALAGAAVARAYDTTYERFMSERFFKPLGMSSSTLMFEEFMARSNRAEGYSGTTAAARKAVKAKNLVAVAPAGAINSTARDMGAWLRFLNAQGQLAALKISPAAYARVFEAHQALGPGSSYGLGFYLETRSGVLFAEHGGNVPGYTAQVAHVPERALSFALLTNQDNSGLAAAAKELFWNIVVRPELPVAAAPKAEPPPPPTSARPISPDVLIGKYFGTNDVTFEVTKADGGLAVILPGVPPLPLKASGVNLYEILGSNGITMAFAESDTMPGRIVASVNLPQAMGGRTRPVLKKDEAWLARARAQHRGPNAELIGSYHSPDRKTIIEIVPYRDGVALNIVGEEPKSLVNSGRDLFGLQDRPDTYRLQIRRSGSNKVIGFTFQEPNKPTLEMIMGEPAEDAGRAREILERAVAAAGGAEALDRIASVTSIGRATAPTQGLDGRAEDRVVPGKRAQLIELGAFGKFLKLQSVTNDRGGVNVGFDGEGLKTTGKALESARFYAVPHPLYRWKPRFASVAMTGETVVNGEKAFVIAMTPPGLAPSKLYISAQSFSILREETQFYVGDEVLTASVADFSDYRMVGGIRMPFAVTYEVPNLGQIVLTYDSVSLDAPIDPKVFDTP